MPILTLTPVEDTYLASDGPEHRFGSKDHLLLGGVARASANRVLARFDLSSLPMGSEITAARLQLYVYRNFFPSRPKIFDVYAVLQEWSEKKANWRRQPVWEELPAASQVVIGEINTFVIWDLVSLARAWHDGSVVNNGLMIKAADERANTLLRLRSRHYQDSSRWPRLTVTYTLPGISVTVVPQPIFGGEEERGLQTADSYLYGAAWDVSLKTLITSLVINEGGNPAEVVLQVSPDLALWVDDEPARTVPPGQTLPFAPRSLMRYMRVKFRSATPGRPTTLRIWHQWRVDA